IVNVAPEFVQEPPLEKVTALPEPPPVAATLKLALNAAVDGACWVTEMAWSALFTVSELEPLLASSVAVAANEAPTPVAYVPALMPARLAAAIVATPPAFVTALPAELPLRVNETDSPATSVAPDVRCAESA